MRESIEGCVIVAVLLNALEKAGLRSNKKWVWVGTALGIIGTVIVGAILIAIYYAVAAKLPNSGKAAFEGVLAIIACTVLTIISLKF